LEIAFAALLISGIALLWYLAVAEFELRRHGKRRLRFPGRLKELLKAAALFLFGGGALTIVYTNVWTRLRGGGWDIRLSLATARGYEIFIMLILTAWGMVLVGGAVHDLIIFIKSRGRSPR
jgi:hypothetical protein